MLISDKNGTINSTASSRENKPDEMCSTLKEFGNEYSRKHGYISIGVCVFGILANLLNILVLTRKEMNASPINKILAGNIIITVYLG